MCNNTKLEVCPGCKLPIDQCYYGGDCLEMEAIYREQQREKLMDIDVDEIHCDVCGYTYGECSHDLCHTGGDDYYE